MSEGRASKLRPGSALVGPRFSLMDLSTSPTTETTMQTAQTPPPLTPGVILASPQGRGTITIVSVDACVTALVDNQVWIWPRRSTERTLMGMGFVVTGHEDPAVLAERVKLAYRSRRAA